MKATPEDVAKATVIDFVASVAACLNEGHARRRGEGRNQVFQAFEDVAPQ